MNYFPGLASNHHLPDLCLLNSWDYRREPLAPGSIFTFQKPGTRILILQREGRNQWCRVCKGIALYSGHTTINKCFFLITVIPFITDMGMDRSSKPFFMSGYWTAYSLIYVFIFEMGSHCVTQAGLKLGIFLSQPPECWDYRRAPPHCLQRTQQPRNSTKRSLLLCSFC
jgi:hypothetical protein